MAPYRAILRYYRCDTPYRAILFKGRLHSPRMVRYPPLVLSFTQADLCDTPFCNVARDDCAIPPPTKTSTKTFCDTIATSIARYGKYRCWASKTPNPFSRIVMCRAQPEGPKPRETNKVTQTYSKVAFGGGSAQSNQKAAQK